MSCRGLSFVLALAAASPALVMARQQAYPAAVEVREGIKTITNPDFPKEGRFAAKLTEEMSWGEEGGPEAGVLNKPLALKVDAEGNVYVMDWGDLNIKVYDSGGRFLRTIGRQGQGPGEFGTPSYFELMKGGRICLLDGGQHRVTILTTGGRYISSFAVKGFYRGVAVDGGDRIYLGQWAAAREPDSLSTEFKSVAYVTSIFRTDETGKDPVHLVDLLGESVAMKSVGGAGTVGMVGGGGVGVVWNVDAQGRLYGGSNETYSLSAFGPDGKIEFVFGRKFTPRRSVKIAGLPGQRGTAPPFSSRSLVFDEQGNLWIELTKDEGGSEFVYDVFSPDGIYLKQVLVGQRIAQFMKGKAYSLLRPEDGYPSVKRYRVDLVPAAR